MDCGGTVGIVSLRRISRAGRAGAIVGELGEQQFPDDALNRMLGAQPRCNHLVVGGAHAGELELAHVMDRVLNWIALRRHIPLVAWLVGILLVLLGFWCRGSSFGLVAVRDMAAN